MSRKEILGNLNEVWVVQRELEQRGRSLYLSRDKYADIDGWFAAAEPQSEALRWRNSVALKCHIPLVSRGAATIDTSRKSELANALRAEYFFYTPMPRSHEDHVSVMEVVDRRYFITRVAGRDMARFPIQSMELRYRVFDPEHAYLLKKYCSGSYPGYGLPFENVS